MTIHDLKNAFNPDDFNPNLGFIYQLNEHKRFEQLILPDQIRAIYIFWWKGKQSDLKKLHRKIKLKGKKIPNKIKEAEDFDHYQHNIVLDTEWMRTFESQDHDSDTYFPIYVGKSTNLRKRIYQHLCTRIDSKEWRQEMLIKMNLDKKETDPPHKDIRKPFYSYVFTNYHLPIKSRIGIIVL